MKSRLQIEKKHDWINFYKNRESVIGIVIQGTKTVEIEYVLWIVNHLKAQMAACRGSK